MKWTDDITLERTARTEHNKRRGTIQLALYALHLFSGNSLVYKTPALKTIKDYIHNVASFLALFNDECWDFRYDTAHTKTFSPYLKAVYDEIARWAKQPNRREQFTTEMLDELRLNVTNNCTDPDSLDAALLDWFQFGLCSGVRRSEFCQDSSHPDPDHPQKDKFQNTRAFTIVDIRMVTTDKRQLCGHEILTAKIVDMREAFVTWRTQKNNNNGEVKLFTLKEKRYNQSAIPALYNIVARFVRLKGTSDTTTPLAIHKTNNPNLPIRSVTDSDVEKMMKKLAAKVYKLSPSNKTHAILLKRWTCHSLRVGACVILHSQGWTGEQIKFTLRWRSDAFMAYLRNCTVMADDQLDRIAAATTST
jgi:hypothetical protein